MGYKDSANPDGSDVARWRSRAKESTDLVEKYKSEIVIISKDNKRKLKNIALAWRKKREKLFSISEIKNYLLSKKNLKEAINLLEDEENGIRSENKKKNI